MAEPGSEQQRRRAARVHLVRVVVGVEDEGAQRLAALVLRGRHARHHRLQDLLNADTLGATGNAGHVIEWE